MEDTASSFDSTLEDLEERLNSFVSDKRISYVTKLHNLPYNPTLITTSLSSERRSLETYHSAVANYNRTQYAHSSIPEENPYPCLSLTKTSFSSKYHKSQLPKTDPTHEPTPFPAPESFSNPQGQTKVTRDLIDSTFTNFPLQSFNLNISPSSQNDSPKSYDDANFDRRRQPKRKYYDNDSSQPSFTGALFRARKDCTLRVWVSHCFSSVKRKVLQSKIVKGRDGKDKEVGHEVEIDQPIWKVRLEGCLLNEESNWDPKFQEDSFNLAYKDDTRAANTTSTGRVHPLFTHFFDKVECRILNRTKYPEEQYPNLVWLKDPSMYETHRTPPPLNKDSHGFEFIVEGNSNNASLEFVFNRRFLSPRFKPSALCIEVLPMLRGEETVDTMVAAIYDYAKINNLFDPADRSRILNDVKLKKLLKVDTVSITDLERMLLESDCITPEPEFKFKYNVNESTCPPGDNEEHSAGFFVDTVVDVEDIFTEEVQRILKKAKTREAEHMLMRVKARSDLVRRGVPAGKGFNAIEEICTNGGAPGNQEHIDTLLFMSKAEGFDKSTAAEEARIEARRLYAEGLYQDHVAKANALRGIVEKCAGTTTTKRN